MKKLIASLKIDYDYIIIDCPAGIEHGFKNAIAGAERAIVVTTPEVSSIRDADRIIGLLNANEVKRVDLIINRIRMDMVKRGDMMSVDDVSEILAINLIGTILDDENVVISNNRGVKLSTINQKSAKAYEEIAKRISGLAIDKSDSPKINILKWLKKKEKDVHKIQSQGL